MNYANLIEDAKLKKTFIVATLVSTVIGTFQAASTLHDKLEEKRERRQKQNDLDSKQNKALKELQEKLKLLESTDNNNNNNNGDGDDGGKGGENGRDGNDNKKKESHRSSSRSRSRSSSRSRRRRRSREEWEDNMYFADSARRSQAMIERTYNDHLQRLGPAYAQGDMITENALQAQTIRLQQTVIGILQDAINTGRGLTRNDLDRLIAAQSSARDGSLRALNGQYERIAYGQPTVGMLRERPVDVATYQHEPAQLAIEPAHSISRHAVPIVAREPTVLAQVPIEEASRHSAIVPPPPHPSDQRGLARMALGSPMRTGSHRSSRRGSPQRAATAIATIDAQVTPSHFDGVSDHHQRKSRAGSPPTRRKSTSLVTQAPKTSVPERKVSSLVNGAASKMDKIASSTVAKTNATQVDGKSAAGQSRSPPKSRRDSAVPHPAANDAPTKKSSTSMVAQALKASPSHLKEALPAAAAASTLKALDTTPHELFCKYSLDLQYSRSKPLSNSFRPSGDQRCPACLIRIPVDTRDVWVLSTHFPGKENRHKVREYRMDSRFVVKCHRPEGGFACVLCDRFRDMDCLCKSVEALVKHLGTAHTPDEFERDPDLVRLKDGSGLGVKSREMVYV